MFSIRTALSLVLLLLMGTLFVAYAEAQEATPRVHILWQKELDSDVLQRRYIGHAEPDVGIVKDSTRTHPIRMVATRKSVYLFDDQGNIERQVPLKKQGTHSARATTAPNGQFYTTRILTSRSFHGRFTRLRVFEADGTFLFELNKGEWTDDDDKWADGSPRWSSLWGAPFIAPNGEYMVVFHNGGGWMGPEEGPEPTFLNFYDMTGTLIKHISEQDFRQYDFIPEILGFSRDGSHVLLTGLNTKVRGFDVDGHRIRQMDLIVFDDQGNLIRRIEGHRTKKLKVARNAIKRLLEPERVKALLQIGGRYNESRTTGLAEFRLLEDRKRGVYANGPTLYLFELNNVHGLVSAFYREFQGLYSD